MGLMNKLVKTEKADSLIEREERQLHRLQTLTFYLHYSSGGRFNYCRVCQKPAAEKPHSLKLLLNNVVRLCSSWSVLF